MLKYSIFLASVFATSTLALAALAPATQSPSNPANVTVIFKNSDQTAFESDLITYCGLEDCPEESEV